MPSFVRRFNNLDPRSSIARSKAKSRDLPPPRQAVG